jgi:Mrp family chromosome partitioning ATPase
VRDAAGRPLRERGAIKQADTLTRATASKGEELEMKKKAPRAERSVSKRGSSTPKGRKRRRLAGYGEESLALVDEAGTVIQIMPTAVTESLRYMVARMRVGDGGEFPARIGLTSSIRGEGVSLMARALALVLSDGSRRVCLVDLNWWSPTVWPGLEEPIDGVAQVILGWSTLDSVLMPMGNAGLSILPAGAATSSERPLLSNSQELEKVLVELGQRFDHVVFDLPAVLVSSEALTLAEKIGTMAVVINQGVTPEDRVKATLDELGNVPVVGAVLNRYTSKIPRRIRRRVADA